MGYTSATQVFLLLGLAQSVISGGGEENVLGSGLPPSLLPDPSQPRPSVHFAPQGANFSTDADPIPCGSTESVYDGSQFLIRSFGFHGPAPAGSCTWNFDVSPDVNVDLMCVVVDVNCRAGNRIVISAESDDNGDRGSLCTKGTMRNQRVSLRTRSSGYKLTLTHVVSGSPPTGSLSCFVRGIGGTANPNPVISDPGSSAGNIQQHRVVVPGCGVNKYKIINGQTALTNEFPWMVFLTLGQFACGGTIVNNRWVMTAGHCAVGMVPSKVAVYTGCQTLYTVATCDGPRAVSRVVVNPGYNGNTVVNDVALVQLTNPIAAFTDRVRAVCLPTADVTTAGYQMQATGWGATASGGSTNNVLKKATMQSITDATCGRYFNIPSSVLCATAVTGTICNGDSGGFLGSKRNGLYEQDGIVSFGASGCLTQYPSGFTEVRYFLSWINSIIAT